jgi:GntR family transcriptional repressor for pyruvate dehydrogenase complex
MSMNFSGDAMIPMARWGELDRSPTLSIKPVRLSDTIAEHVKQLIMEGILQAGERLLAERDLSVKLGVSRPSLREGLDKLVDQGLLVRDVQGIAYVNENIGKQLRDPLAALMDNPEARSDLMELRAVVEAAAAGYAAERASEVNREQLKKRMDAMLAAHDSDDVDEISRTDAEFHFAVYEASHNIMMLHFMRSLEELLLSSVYLNRENLYKHRSNPVSQIAEHKAIFDAIMNRDVKAAQEAAHQHMQTAIETQKSIYEAERRLEASIRRLSRSDLVVPPRRRK